MKNIIFLGPPGAGKGTQAKVAVERTGLTHVSTGDLFRAALREGTPLGLKAKSYMDKGELVPDDVVIDMLLERLEQPDITAGVIFDGFPRTLEQARALDETLERRGAQIAAVLLFAVEDEVLVQRISGRLTSKTTGEVYNRYFNPPRDAAGNDISDSDEYYQRPDDNEETVRNRLRVYHNQTSPLIAYYRERGVLHELDGQQEMADVTRQMLEVIGA
ncbi:MAG: adenylate kinase [Chloroflexaceae bacterium]|nr:adenylate kinase [Chloroflexaceae bacterium]